MSLNSINRLVMVMEVSSVYCHVVTGRFMLFARISDLKV